MPIPFHDVDDIDELGAAGFFKLEPLPGIGAVVGLLVINVRGEPLEFAFNRMELAHPFLWTERLARRYLERRLVTSVLSVCSHDPRLLVCLANELDDTLLGRDLRLDVPLVRIAHARPSWPGHSEVIMSVSNDEVRAVDPATGEVLDTRRPDVQVSWQPAPPGEDSTARRLFDRLSAAGLLVEPFERASVGLREVYAARALDRA
jgi:hypothetical protein